MTYLQRYIIRRGDPRHIILHVVGAIWGSYFLWLHNWIWAVAVILFCAIVAELLTAKLNTEGLARTTLGKIMLLHLHPVNLTVQIAGGSLLVYGLWNHSTLSIMSASSLILLGHLWGWNKVNEVLQG